MVTKNTNTKTKEVEQISAEKKFPTSEAMIADGLTTKSARIRHLHALGMAIGDIARQETGGLYQHAYNVIKKPLKRPEGETASKESAATPAPAQKGASTPKENVE